MASTSFNLQETVNHISSTPGSFAIVSSTPNWPIPPKVSSSKLHISVLDSSFNPPTIAHQQIAFSTFPPPSSSFTPSNNPPSYTSRLLLFSARNVEKTLKSGDATPQQRVGMMSILASLQSNTHPKESIAVGLINEPTFVGKALIVRDYLSTLPYLDVEVDLSFLVGTDTLIRFFDPRFYPPNEMSRKIQEYFRDSNAYLISARRGINEEDRAIENEILNRDGVREWVDKGKLRLLGTGQEGWEEVSSTIVRQAVGGGDWEKVEKLVGKEVMDYIRKEELYST
ncbi:hypothetical protein L486_01435 [Kwoniella mangroviensis CBS 10435]|uniref:Nicotinamide-nucleotide adenylyltransferase n=1 Tax=Kwoniella mangroviensis CBS 10435 TaxID=1331196 RepID=A0A1B9J291_9TREE|nr:uncharacterized protein I203_03899 [Kwoniella mangroviensis CBS 8507]OCF61774.1 hypothetical protein L486_01435 [Kwoniella mangroviensis CBS 10435]OCF67212.1 hypothetical protein I203_03899 [Kwoniella mangroviensis CBS 8507]